MLNFGTFFLWALAVFTLWRGSWAEDPNQCESSCLTELRPLLKQVVQGQGQGNTCDANNETNAKLARLVNQKARFRGQLQEVQAKLEAVEAKLEGRFLEVKSNLHGLKMELREDKLEAGSWKDNFRHYLSRWRSPKLNCNNSSLCY